MISGKKEGGRRGEVKSFSYRSERRMRLVLEDTIELWQGFAVLTYPRDFPLDGRKVKRDVEAMRRWYKRRGVKDIFWGLEFQGRGAAHINVLLSAWVDKRDMALAWYKIVGSGDLRHLKAGTRIEAISDRGKLGTYLIGYQYKREQKDVPAGFENVGRFWGCTRRERAKGVYTYRVDNESALVKLIKPVVDCYEAKIKEWAKERGKEYTWQFRGRSFVFWGGSEIVNKFIEEGVFSEEKREKRKEEREEEVGSRRLG
jgi:hypothetical protein